jgi:hypothetical protein
LNGHRSRRHQYQQEAKGRTESGLLHQSTQLTGLLLSESDVEENSQRTG